MSITMKDQTVMNRGAPHLPQEMITNILKRLPVKSLIRFQCVCKDWKNLFKTPSFVAEHLHHSTHQNPCLLFEHINPRRLCLITPDMQVLEYQISPFTNSSVCRFIPSSNNGLVCLQLMKSKSYCLWNPAIREVRHVARPLSFDRYGFSYLGFGFSPILNDYKIVRLVSTLNLHVARKVEVFSLCTGSWKRVEVGKLEGIISAIHSPGFTFDGAIFWLSFKREVGEDGYRVVSFDIATEAFTLIPFPSSPCKSDYYKLDTYENKLAMLSHNKVVNMESSWIDLWVMDKCKDASKETCIWNKIYTTNIYPCLLHPVTIWRNEIVCKVKEMQTSIRGRKVVWENNVEARLVFCNLHTNEFKEFGKCSFTTPIWNYKESIISDPAEIGLGQNGIGGPTQKYEPVAPRRSLRLKKRAFKLLDLDEL